MPRARKPAPPPAPATPPAPPPPPPPPPQIADPVAARAYLGVAFLIVLGMILWVVAMTGY